ncbi:MAG: CpaF family protein [Actinomycetota bacterium]|nr:CpaF family protein [Actinomycetota bacterium]
MTDLDERVEKLRQEQEALRLGLPNTLVRDVHEAVIREMGPSLYDRGADRSQIEKLVAKKLAELLGDRDVEVSADQERELAARILADVLGWGPLDELLADESVTEIMVNRPDKIYVERKGKIETAQEKFRNEGHVRRIIDKIVGQVGRRIDEGSPMVDARLPDGSRVNAVIPPLAIGGAKLTVRKFAAKPLTIDDLIGFGTINRQAATFLNLGVRGRLNVLVSGGTGSGKTTLLNVLSSFIPANERIVTIEDAVELQLMQDHVVQLESRPPNVEGKGQITIRDLVRNSLRMRPDRIIVGEVRGGEALDMLQAMNTGHDGSLGTVHANSPRDVLSRLETMVLMSGMELPVSAIRQQMAAAIDLIVHLARLRDGSRRVTQITEITGMEADIITMQDLFVFQYAKTPVGGRIEGMLQSSGIRPRSLEHLQEMGLDVPSNLFGGGKEWPAA